MNDPDLIAPGARPKIECRYIWFLRWLIPFGVLFFVGLGALFLYAAFSTSPRPAPLWTRALFTLLGAGFVYVAFSGVRLLPFRSALIVADDTGLRVSTPRSDRFYPWHDIARVTDHSILQILDVYTAAGTRILSVDYFISRFPLLRKRIFQHLKRKASGAARASAVENG